MGLKVSTAATMRVRIHRGAHEVGGNCIELEARGSRLVLDLGRPIIVPKEEDVPLPDVAGLRGGDTSLLGVVLSHPHLDHFGLISKVASEVPLFVGEAASRILHEAAFFSPAGLVKQATAFLRHRETFAVGPFRVTPFLNDHSAFDAYSMLVEADGRRLFYTGDIRGHGRKAALFDELLRRPPESVHALLVEGTHVRADSDPAERGPTEVDVEDAFRRTCLETKGMVLAMFSPQNIDRLVSVYKAAIATNRELVIDLYTAAIAAATGLATIPQAHWDRVRVYLPSAQRARVVATRAFHRVEAVRSRRIFAEELAARRSETVMLFRGSMVRELSTTSCFDGARAVWSMWPGYLREPSSAGLLRFFEERGIPMSIHHASGHAFVADLQRIVEAIAPERVVPIHTFAGDRYRDLFPRIDRRIDGEWWPV